MSKRRYSDSQIEEAARNCKSMAQLLTTLGLKPTGGNYSQLKGHLVRLHVNTEHWTGKVWNKGMRLKDWCEYKTGASIRNHVISERGWSCEVCKLAEWMNVPIKLELHHIDGDNMNNDIGNLQLLCPNCHSLTDTWRQRKL